MLSVTQSTDEKPPFSNSSWLKSTDYPSSFEPSADRYQSQLLKRSTAVGHYSAYVLWNRAVRAPIDFLLSACLDPNPFPTYAEVYR